MSNVSNIHAIVPFDSAKSKAFTGQRLSKISYKTRKVNGIESKLQSMCASIPCVNVSEVQENIAAFTGHVVALIESTQDAMIREMYESGLTNVDGQAIGIVQVLEYLDAQSSGSRLTKEEVTTWFDAILADVLAIAFAEKLGINSDGSNLTPELENKISCSVNVYRDKISSLSGGKTRFPAEVCDKLIKALEFADDADVMKVRFVRRLEEMKSKKDVVDMMSI